MYCENCGKEINEKAFVCVSCGVPTKIASVKSRLTYILLGIFLGSFGIHNFYAGYKNKAVAQLLITVLAGWLIFPLAAVWIWVILDICTVKEDAQGQRFQNN